MSNQKEIIFIVVAGTLILLVLAGFVIYFLMFYFRRRRQHKIEKETMLFQYQEELLRSQLEIREQTLKNISQEIHDNIGQTLSLAKLNLNTLDLQGQISPHEKLATTRELVSKAIVDLRNLSKSMNTDAVLAAGLLKAIEYELQLVAKAGFTTSMEVTGQTMRLNPQKELILFRMVQEAINNIIKHAGATTIRVRISFTENRMELVLDDDGAGFDPSAFSTDMDSGAGLRNMKSRAALIGGQLDIQSIPQKGTSIIITLPTTT